MSVPRPVKAKPASATETERVTRIYEWLISWADKNITATRTEVATLDQHLQILTLADRIAARTED